MSRKQRGVYIDLLAAAWDSEEPGTLPLPIELAAKIAMIDVRSLRDLLSKFPRTFVEVGSKLVNEKLIKQYVEHLEFVESKSIAGKVGNKIRWKKTSHSDRSSSASAFAPASAIKEKSKPIPAAAPPLVLPVWLIESTWKEFCADRSERGFPITQRASKMIFKKLEAWMAAGQNPHEILEQSIMNGWRGVFPLKGARDGQSSDPNERVRQSLRNLGLDNQTRTC